METEITSILTIKFNKKDCKDFIEAMDEIPHDIYMHNHDFWQPLYDLAEEVKKSE